MKYVSTYELLQPIVNAIDKTFKITSIVDNGSFNYTINSCNTLWATNGFPITINGHSYTIKSIIPNTSITVQGSVALTLTTTSFQLYPPVFYHGTLNATEYDFEKKIGGQLLTWDRLPMIWLHEPTDEQMDESPLKCIGLRSRCELYFMINSDFEGWDNDGHYTYAVRPMRNLIESFMNAINKARTLNPILVTSSTPKDLPRFNSYSGKDNSKMTIFSCPMSGCRFDVEIPWFKQSSSCR